MKHKTGLQTVLLLLLLLSLAGLLFLRCLTREPSAVPETALAPPSPAPTAAPSPAPALTAAPAPTDTPAPFMPPKGYTEESYRLVSDMVYAYADRQEEAAGIIQDDLSKLNVLDPALASLWGKLMDYWAYVNTNPEIYSGVLPDGLPDDDSLCIVVLGFQLHPDGTMSEELLGRCETALRCLEKYPRALIAVTGGPTASVSWQRTPPVLRRTTLPSPARSSARSIRRSGPSPSSRATTTCPLGCCCFRRRHICMSMRRGSSPSRSSRMRRWIPGAAAARTAP